MNSQTDGVPPGISVRIRADDSPGATVHTDWDTGQPSLRGFGGVEFIDPVTKQPVDAPAAMTIPHDYAEKHHWIELVNPTATVAPAGNAEQPYAKTHTFPNAEALLLHMADGDYRYRVVHQPGKYDDETGDIALRGGDPTTHVDWFYVVELDATPMEARHG